MPLWQRWSRGHPALPKAAQAWLIITGHSGALCLHSRGFLFSHWSARALLHSRCCPLPAGAAWESWHGHSPARGTALSPAVAGLAGKGTPCGTHSIPWSPNGEPGAPTKALPAHFQLLSRDTAPWEPLSCTLWSVCVQEGPHKGWHLLPDPLSVTFPSCICPRMGHSSPLPVPACRSSAPGSVVTAGMHLAPALSWHSSVLGLALSGHTGTDEMRVWLGSQ